MLRSLALGGAAAAAMASGCCYRPLCGPGPSLYNPPPAPLFPRLHPSYWANPPAPPAPPPVAAPVGLPVGTGLPPGGYPYGGSGLPPGAIPTGEPYTLGGGPMTSPQPPGMLATGPLGPPAYFAQPPVLPPAASLPPPGSTLLPAPKAVGEPAAMPGRQ